MATNLVIAVIDDNSDDHLLIRRAFGKAGYDNPILPLVSGDEAVLYFKGEGIYGDRSKFPLPQLVLLDLKMPGMNGHDFLCWLREQSAFKDLPVIVLTTSPYEPDVNRAYGSGANSFVTKPTDYQDFATAIKDIASFWLGRCRLPALQLHSTAPGLMT
jgi:CheY-like chemotaxis protein